MENIITIKPTRSKRKNPTTIEISKEKLLKNNNILVIKHSNSEKKLSSLSDKILIFEDSLTLKNLTKLINTKNNDLNNNNINNNTINEEESIITKKNIIINIRKHNLKEFQMNMKPVRKFNSSFNNNNIQAFSTRKLKK